MVGPTTHVPPGSRASTDQACAAAGAAAVTPCARGLVKHGVAVPARSAATLPGGWYSRIPAGRERGAVPGSGGIAAEIGGGVADAESSFKG